MTKIYICSYIYITIKKIKKLSEREREKRERENLYYNIITLNIIHLDTMISEKSLCLHVKCAWLIDRDRVMILTCVLLATVVTL